MTQKSLFVMQCLCRKVFVPLLIKSLFHWYVFFNEEPYYVTQRSLVSLLIESPFHWFQKI